MEQKAGGAFENTRMENLVDWLLQFMTVKRKIYPKKIIENITWYYVSYSWSLFLQPLQDISVNSYIILWYFGSSDFYLFWMKQLYWDKIWDQHKKIPLYLKDLGLYSCASVFLPFKNQ